MLQVESGIYRKGEAGWDAARLAWNRVTNQRPEVVVRAASAADVGAAFEIARAEGLRVAVQSSGHGAGPALDSLDGALLLDMSGFRDIEIDPSRQVAKVGAGVLWGELATAAAAHGLAGLAGSSPDVAVAGYCLGGGIGFLARRFGMAANSVLGIDVVLADGTALRVDAVTDPDLFWALRGGGGSFAVVTGLELRLFPVRSAYAGFMFWPAERARDILHTWFAWTAEVSDDVTTTGRIMQFPPIPDVPEPLRGRAFVGFDGAVLAASEEAAEIVAPLRALRPELDTFREVPAPGLGAIHLDPDQPVSALANGYVLDGFDRDGLDSLLSVAPPASRSALVVTEVRHLGGALARPRPDQGSAGAISGEHLVFGVGMAMTPEMAGAVNASLDALGAAVAPWLADRQQLNFGDRPRPAGEFFAAADLDRLRSIRRRCDPSSLLLSNRPLG